MHYKCIEFVSNDEILLGIEIKNIENHEFKIINLFTLNQLFFKFNKIIYNQFDCLSINSQYNDLLKKLKNENKTLNNNINLKKSYIQKPYCRAKTNFNLSFNEWHYIIIIFVFAMD